ncbi:MAG: hypothetical protein ACRDYC_05030, partial [Acidimicrobiales bacterium]
VTGLGSLPWGLCEELARFADAAATALHPSIAPGQILLAVRDRCVARSETAKSVEWKGEGRRLLLACPAVTLFSIATPAGTVGHIHDHQTWGLVGQLAGTEIELTFARRESTPEGMTLEPTGLRRLAPGDVTLIEPPAKDVHQVINVGVDTSVSLHAFAHDLVAKGFNQFRAGPYRAIPYRGAWLDHEVLG